MLHSQLREECLVLSKALCGFPSIILAADSPFLEAEKCKPASILMLLFAVLFILYCSFSHLFQMTALCRLFYQFEVGDQSVVISMTSLP
jgi:hypothetical protein